MWVMDGTNECKGYKGVKWRLWKESTTSWNGFSVWTVWGNEKFTWKFVEYVDLDNYFPKHLDDPSSIS